MIESILSRRECLWLSSAGVAAGVAGVLGAASGAGAAGQAAGQASGQAGGGGAAAAYPAGGASSGIEALPNQDPALVLEMVGASHGKIDRVRELLAQMPQLANATVDWGFGDWETAIGAAAHTGRREIAEMLLAHGARPDLFCFAMLGKLGCVKAAIEAMPGIQKTRGPHGISLLAHARTGGDAAKGVVEYLTEVGGADEPLAALPISDDLKQAVSGTYRFALPAAIEGRRDESHKFEVFEKNGSLWIKRGSKPQRGLALRSTQGEPIASAAFSPAGAPDVRVTFVFGDGGKQARRLAVTAPMLVIEAERE